MSITTYAELKTAIGDWLDRSDLTSYLGDFITFAEGHFNRELRHRKMITTTDLTPSSNVCTLPTDYLNYVRVVEKVSPRRDLTFITSQAADQLYSYAPSGLANHFTIIGDNLKAYPLSSNDIELTYRQKIPALSDANTTNWLLSLYPQAYLRLSQLMAMEFTDETDTARYKSAAILSQKIMDDINREGQIAEYYKASVHVRGATP